MDPMSIDFVVDQSKIPLKGIISRTTIQGSNVQAILPAQICQRPESHPYIPNPPDLIFVHKTHIVIKEYAFEVGHSGEIANACLEEVMIKDDFDSTITSAMVLPEPPEDTAMDLDRDQMVRSGKVLITTLRRGRYDSIAFLVPDYFTKWEDQAFTWYQKPLRAPSKDREALRLGAHLAADPRARAIAVASRESNVVFYRLKPLQDWFVQNGDVKEEGIDNFNPLAEERNITISGTVLKMDFLRSPNPDPDTVILLLVVAFDNKRTQLQRWDWDCRKHLSTGLRQIWSEMPVDSRFRNPQLLIPFTSKPGFFLVADGMLGRFSDIMSGVPNCDVRPLPHPSEPGQERVDGQLRTATRLATPAKWTAWARPSRRHTWYQENDDFYICREDGLVQYLEFKLGSHIDVTSENSLGAAVDTAFAAIDDLKGSEALVTADGFFSQPITQHAVKEQHLDNWNYLRDFAIMPGTPSISLIGCAGHSQYQGKLCHLRNALEGRVGGSYPVRSINLWVLPSISEPSLCLLAGDSETHVEMVLKHDISESNSLVDGPVQRLVDTTSKTLFAGSVANDMIVQITSGAIRAVGPTGSPEVYDIAVLDAKIVMAWLDEEQGYIAVVLRKGNAYLASSAHVRKAAYRVQITTSGESLLTDAHHIGDEPSSMTAWHPWVAIATWNHNLTLLKYDGGTLVGLQTLRFEEAIVIESMVFLPELQLLMCGTRDGYIYTNYFQSDHLQPLDRYKTRVGTGSVALHPHTARSILAVCDGRLSQMAFSKDESNQPIASHQNIALRNLNKGATVVGLAHVPACVPETPRLLLPVTSSSFTDCADFQPSLHVHMGSLGNLKTFADIQNIFNKQNACQPTHILCHDGQILVAYQETILVGDQPNARRQVFSKIKVIENQPTGLNLHDSERDIVVGLSGETIHDFLEWKAITAEATYRLIVICTERRPKAPDLGSNTGRIYLYTVSAKSNLIVRAKLKFPWPVLAAAAYTPDTLIICTGKELQTRKLIKRPDAKLGWQDGPSITLRSPAKAVSVTEHEGKQFIHVAMEDCVMVYDHNQRAIMTSPGYSAPIVGQGPLLTKESRPTLLLPTIECLLGLSYPNTFDHDTTKLTTTARVNSSLDIVFEARFPSTINRLHYYRPRDCFIGSSINGAFYQMKVLGEHEWRLLRYLQNMAELDWRLSPYTYKDKLSAMRFLEPSERYKATAMHINGDLLARVAQRNYLGTLLATAQAAEHEHDLRTPADRLRRLHQLAGKIFGDISQDDLVERTLSWLKTWVEPCV